MNKLFMGVSLMETNIKKADTLNLLFTPPELQTAGDYIMWDVLVSSIISHKAQTTQDHESSQDPCGMGGSLAHLVPRTIHSL